MHPSFFLLLTSASRIPFVSPYTSSSQSSKCDPLTGRPKHERRNRERERKKVRGREQQQEKRSRITIHGHKLKVRKERKRERERIRKPCQALSSLPIFSTKFLHPFSPWPISHPDFFQRMAFDCSPVSREGKRRKESAVQEPSVVQMIRWIKRRERVKERERNRERAREREREREKRAKCNE